MNFELNGTDFVDHFVLSFFKFLFFEISLTFKFR